MKSFLRHALLIATWLFTVGIILYLWVAKAIEPPYWPFIILLAIAALPLASRLRIGNWFDFTKKIGDLTQQVDINKKDIQQLGTQITNLSTCFQNVILTKQAQHQIIANILNPETAEAFAKAMSPSSQPPLPPQQNQLTEASAFVYSADLAIDTTNLPLRISYAFCVRLLENRLTPAPELFDLKLTSLIEKLKLYLPQIKNLHPDLRDNLIEGMDALARLIALRQDVASGKAQPPSMVDGLKLINDSRLAALSATAILLSIVQTFAHIMRLPPTA